MIRGSIIILALASLVAMNGCTKCGGENAETPAETTAPEATPDAAVAPAPEATPADGAAPADPNAAPAADGAAASPTPGM